MAPSHSETLADKLSGERHRWFVGRRTEALAFEAALAEPTCSLLFLRGPTGVGKSSLLQELERVCRDRAHPVLLVDAGALTPGDNPSSTLLELKTGLAQRQSPAQRLRPVLLVDAFETLRAADQSPVAQLGKALPADTLLVFASRKAPPQWLLIDPAWSRLTRFLEILPWGEDEALQFLRTQRLEPHLHAEIVKVAGGYPLALMLAVRVLRESQHDAFEPSDVRDLQTALAESVPVQAGSRTHQVALDVCVLVRQTRVELLEYVLRSNPDCDPGGAQEAFEWLAQQTFIDRRKDTLRPHAIARLSMLARVRREHKYQAIFRPVREFYVSELADGSRADADFDELFFIDRDVEVLREQEVAAADGPSLAPARDHDHGEIVKLVRQKEGIEAAEHCESWLRSSPGSFEVARSTELQRFLQITYIASINDIPLSNADPASRLAARFVHDHPLEQGAVAIFFRWFMDRIDYQTPSARVFCATARQTQVIVALPRVQYSLCVFRSPEEWYPLWDSARAAPQVVGTFELDGERYSLIAFSFAEHSLREQLVETNRVAPPSVPASRRMPVTVAPSESSEERRALEIRIAELSTRFLLTKRESRVLHLLCLGQSFDAIALSMHITARTVRFHQGNVFRKLGATSRVDLFRQLI